MVGRNNEPFGGQDAVGEITIDFQQNVTINFFGDTVTGQSNQNFTFRIFGSIIEFR